LTPWLVATHSTSTCRPNQQTTVRVEDLERRSGAYCHLDDIAGNDFLKIIEAFLAESSGFSLSNRAEHKLIRVRRYSLRDRTLDGIIETGDYGYEAELVDSQTQEVAHRQQTTEAQMLPFYFLADLPTQRDEGTLILQRFHPSIRNSPATR
jgi:hypothetical protein